MPLSSDIKFQKTLALAASASNSFEAEAAERAARRLMEQHRIDPTEMPDYSLYNRMNFADNALLAKLRAEWREQHPPAPEPVKPVRQIPSDYLDGPAIPFNMNGFSKFAHKRKIRKSPRKRADVVVTLELLEMIHGMFRDGVAPLVARHTFGLTKGQIAGIKGRYDAQQRSQHQQVAPASAGDANRDSTEQT